MEVTETGKSLDKKVNVNRKTGICGDKIRWRKEEEPGGARMSCSERCVSPEYSPQLFN